MERLFITRLAFGFCISFIPSLGVREFFLPNLYDVSVAAVGAVGFVSN